MHIETPKSSNKYLEWSMRKGFLASLLNLQLEPICSPFSISVVAPVNTNLFDIDKGLV